MIGLIKKDLLMTMGNLKTLTIIFVVFILVSINGNGNFLFIPAFISVMTMMTTFSYDEYNKSDAYITTLPNGKKNAVKSKYIATLLIVLVSLILTFGISIVVGIIKEHINIEETVSTTIGCGVGVLLLQSVLYPLIYKFGIEKSRIAIFVGIFGISTIVSFLMKKGFKLSIPKNIITLLNTYWMVLVPLLMLLVLWISYKISEQIYIRKEF